MKTPTLFFWMLVLAHPLVLASDDDHHDHSDHQHKSESQEPSLHKDLDEHDHKHENTSLIPSNLAEQVGIETVQASQQTLQQTMTVYGSLATGPEQLSHVRARFEGLITSVNVSIGDRVEAGDLLAEVESNESLKIYQMKAPISGLIVQRHANTGEVTQDQVLFSIANFESLWAELRIYSAQQSSLKEGQVVNIIGNDGNKIVTATINHIIPALEKPYQLARVKVKNNGLLLSPGHLVEALIETKRFSVPLAVELEAIQSMDGREGVFVKHEHKYSFSPLLLGRRDSYFVEVLEGLHEDDEYVNKNSYLIKADIEKSEAEHQH